MSLVTLDYIEAPYYITPSIGDIDQDPNQTEICASIHEDEVEEIYDRPEPLPVVVEAVDIIPEALKDSSGSSPGSSPEGDDDQDDPEPESQGTAQLFKPTFNVAEKMNEVLRGTYETRFLSKSKQVLSRGNPQFAREETELTFHSNYRKNKDGTIEMINKHHLKRQKKVLGHLLKQFGSNIFAGKSVSGLSLPVTIFEPRSHLERMASGLTYAPHFLRQGGNTTDTLVQFKYAIAHFICSMHLLINPQKPFNPLLGETFQGIIDGCPVYMEQVSHHPPVSSYQMVGENFRVEGSTESTAAMAANSVKTRKVGYPRVVYPNTKATIRAQYPTGLMQGTTMGKRTFQFIDKFYIFDIENRYYCEIDFEHSGHSVLKKNKNSKDTFTGKIWKVNGRFAERLKSNMQGKDLDPKFKEKEHAEKVLDAVEGAWLEYLKIGNNTLWTYGNPWPYKLQYFDNPLPSDSNYRLDVLYLRVEDEVKSQEHKKILEEVQRRDRKLKEQPKGKPRK